MRFLHTIAALANLGVSPRELEGAWQRVARAAAGTGGNLEWFLDEEKRRYREQLERYARLLAPLGEPVRLGLYFPLLDAWREWVPEMEEGAHE